MISDSTKRQPRFSGILTLGLIGLWISLPILCGYTGRTEQDETVYLEPLVNWFQNGNLGNSYVAGLAPGVERISFLQPPGWLYFMFPFYGILGFGYLTVRVAFVVQVFLLGFLLQQWGRRSASSLLLTIPVFIFALSSPNLLAEPGRMDLLAGLCLATTAYLLTHEERTLRRDLAAGIFLGFTGLVHPLAGTAGGLAIVVMLALQGRFFRRVGLISAIAAATTLILWMPIIASDKDLFIEQFIMHGERHVSFLAGVPKIAVFFGNIPVVFLPIILAPIHLITTRRNATANVVATVMAPLAGLSVALAFVLTTTVSYYYYLNFLIPLAAALLLIEANQFLRVISRHRNLLRFGAVGVLALVLVFRRGPVFYDQLLIPMNAGSSPEAVIARTVTSSVPSGFFVVTDPVAYYSIRSSAGTTRELETFASTNTIEGYKDVDYLVLFERNGEMFFRNGEMFFRLGAESIAYVSANFNAVATQNLVTKRLSLRNLSYGLPVEEVYIGKLQILRNKRLAYVEKHL